MKTHESSSISDSYVLLDVSHDPPQFVTICGGSTSNVLLAERFPDLKSAKKIKRAFERVSRGEKYRVARFTHVSAFKVEWDDSE